jgi:hypothetical protein
MVKDRKNTANADSLEMAKEVMLVLASMDGGMP